MNRIIKNIGDIPYDPVRRPEDWCEIQPCWEIDGLIISQPLSSFIVYLTALITINVGVHFVKQLWEHNRGRKTKNKTKQANQIGRKLSLKRRFSGIRKGDKAILYMGISFLLVGIGAALAGTSYQAFGYEIKCRNRNVCMWTSWWEIAYMVFTVLGVGTLLVGVAHSIMGERFQKISKIYFYATSMVYLVLIIIGSILPVKFLISFEMMLIFVSPIYLGIIFISIKSYLTQKNEISKKLMIAALLLFIAIGGYYVYYLLGITEYLWERDIWFSANDVLHILMIVWVIYIDKSVRPFIKEKQSNNN